MKKRGTIKEQEANREKIVVYLFKNSENKSRMIMAASEFGVTRQAVYKIWTRFEANRRNSSRQLDSVKSKSRGKNNKYNEMLQEVKNLVLPYVNERDLETGEKVSNFGKSRFHVKDVENLTSEISRKLGIEISKLQMKRCLNKLGINPKKKADLWPRINSEENLKRLRSFQYQAKRHKGQEIWIYKSGNALIASNDRGYFRFMSINWNILRIEGFKHFLQMLMNPKKKLFLVVLDFPKGNKKKRKELQEWISEESQSLEMIVIS